MLEFDFCRALGNLNGQIEDDFFFLEVGSNLHTKVLYIRAEIEKYFVRFWVQVKVVEFAFEIN